MTETKNKEGNSQKIDLPVPDGPYSVGVIDFELLDEQRPDADAPGGVRHIPVRAWSPAESVSGAPRPYAKPEEMEHQVKPFWVESLHMPEEVPFAFDVLTHSYENAVPASCGPCPTLIFSHGGFAYLQTNTALMEHLASHGYVVLSITHPYASYGSIYADGSVAPFDDSLVKRAYALGETPGYLDQFFAEDVSERLETHLWVCHSGEHPMATPTYHVWVADCLHAIDRVCSGNLPAAADLVSPLIDAENVATFGMSLGASTTLAAYRDKRVKATINLDGGQFASDLTDIDMLIPTLVLHSDHDLQMPGRRFPFHSEFAYEKFATMGQDPKVQRFEVKGIGHVGVTDAALVPESVKAANPIVAAGIGSIDGPTMINIMNDFVRSFFDLHLKGEGNGVDKALVAQYPDVVDVDLSYIREWAASNPEPGFMSYTHMFIMNRKAAASEEASAALAKLDRRYLLVFELTGGEEGETVWWQMEFDPDAGFAFRMGEPNTKPDLLMQGDYTEYMQFIKAMKDGNGQLEDEPVTRIGDLATMEAIAESFAAVRTASAVKAKIPGS